MIGLRSARASASTLDASEYAAAVDLLRRRAGLVFPDNRRPQIEAAMTRVMRDAGIADGGTLLRLLEDDGAVFDDLAAEVTIGESYFFREKAHFELIRSTIVPQLRAARPDRHFRAWSAACAAGEEAYSLAITLADLQVAGEVLGTDISRPRLRAARHGTYRQWALRGVTETTTDQWFRRDGDEFTVSPTARRHTTFRYLNLAEDAYPSLSTGVWGMDLILCRNVLIYFDAPTIERVCRSLVNALSDDGWLLLGAADPPLTGIDWAEVVETAGGLAYRRPQGVLARVPRPIAQQPRPPTETPAAAIDFPTPLSRPPPAAAASGDAIAKPAAPRAADQIRALANLGRLDEAGRACASALDAERDNAELHYLHSVLLLEGGRPVEAMSAARRALYLDRHMIVAHLIVATAGSRSGDSAAASRALASAERLLDALPPETLVDASDGTTAGRLLQMTRVQRRLLSENTA